MCCILMRLERLTDIETKTPSSSCISPYLAGSVEGFIGAFSMKTASPPGNASHESTKTSELKMCDTVKLIRSLSGFCSALLLKYRQYVLINFSIFLEYAFNISLSKDTCYLFCLCWESGLELGWSSTHPVKIITSSCLAMFLIKVFLVTLRNAAESLRLYGSESSRSKQQLCR